jgi:hypothetical protein
MKMARNEYGSGGRHTARNPTERGMNVPSAPASHVGVVGRAGPTGIANSDPQALADRVRGGKDASQGDASGANRSTR